MPAPRNTFKAALADGRTVIGCWLGMAEGYAADVAHDGAEGLDKIRAKAYDLVLLDVMMPRKSGLKVFQEMKRDPELEKIPIIIVTGLAGATGADISSGKEEEKESYSDDVARRFGAALREQLSGLTPDGLIEKPIDPEALLAKIQELLS